MTKQTIRLYLFLALVRGLGISFISATYVIFLTSRGLNLFEVNLVNLVFFATLFICEIPTGAIADVFGRKISFVCSCFLFCLGMFVYALSKSFWGFALAEAISAIGATFASGAFQAWLVDRLKHFGYTESFNSIFTKEQQISSGVSILGALLGSFLADKNMILPWIAGGCVMLLGGIFAMIFMKEEYFVREKFSFINGIKSMRETVHISLHYGLKNKVLRFVILLGTVQYFAIQAPNMQWQPLFSHFLPNKTSLGFLWAGMIISVMVGASFSTKFLKYFKSEKRALIVSQVIIGLGILFTVLFRLFPIALSMFFIHEMARGLFRPLKDVYLNDNIPSKERATLISFESISHHIGGMVGLLVSGFVAEKVDIPTAWILSGTVLVGSTLLMIKNNIKTKN